jgi:hypothetical protein
MLTIASGVIIVTLVAVIYLKYQKTRKAAISKKAGKKAKPTEK